MEAEHQFVNQELEQTDDHSINPYAAPVSAAAPALPEEQQPLLPPEPGRVIRKWFVVCFVAAGPSFYLGAGIGNWQTPELLGMVLGILIFVAGYSAIEFLPQVQSAMTQRAKRKATRIAYITRMGISVLFPIGVLIDLWCGVFSVSLSSALSGSQGLSFGNINDGAQSSLFRCSTFLLTTLIQGTLLNIIVFGYMMIVYGFLRALGIKDSSPQTDEEPTHASSSGS